MSTREGKVVFVKKDPDGPPPEIVVNLGYLHGVTSATSFIIYALGDEIRDPETGESLGALEILKGRGRPKHIQEQMSTVVPITTKRQRRVRNPLFALGEIVEEVEEEEEFDRSVEVGDRVRMQ